MGQVLTVIAMDLLALPDWMDLHTDEHAEQWLAMLEEHDTALRRLTDSHSEELALLEQYRRTFQTDGQEAVAAFAEFLGRYGPLVFRRRAQGHWTLPQFSSQSVKEIFDASPECRITLDSPGFGAVAAAVRKRDHWCTRQPPARRRYTSRDSLWAPVGYSPGRICWETGTAELSLRIH
jgi:hypothetical protein